MSRILLVEDSPTQTLIVSGSLESTEYQLESVGLLNDAVKRIRNESFGAVVLDLSLPDSEGLDTYLRMQEAAPSTPIVVLTSTDDEELALEMLRNGIASQYNDGVDDEETGRRAQRRKAYASAIGGASDWRERLDEGAELSTRIRSVL